MRTNCAQRGSGPIEEGYVASLECRLTPSPVFHGWHVFLKQKESLPVLNDLCRLNSRTEKKKSMSSTKCNMLGSRVLKFESSFFFFPPKYQVQRLQIVSCT